MKLIYHKQMEEGGWQRFNLAEQMGNIGSEVYRSIKWFRAKNDERFRIAFEMALELFDLTLADERWKGPKRKEIARSREVFCTLLTDTEKIENLDKELDSLDDYFLQFALLARKDR